MSDHQSRTAAALRNYSRALKSIEQDAGSLREGSYPLEDSLKLFEDCRSFRDSLSRDPRIKDEQTAVKNYYQRLSTVEETLREYLPPSGLSKELVIE